MDNFKTLFDGDETIELAAMINGYEDYDEEWPHIKFDDFKSKLNKINYDITKVDDDEEL